MEEVCRAHIWERPRTGMSEEGERFKEVPTVRVPQVHGESLRGSASLNFASSLPHLPHPSPSPGEQRQRLGRYLRRQTE